jgi:uncharacterized protein with PIN domain
MFEGIQEWWRTHQCWGRYFDELEKLAYQYEHRTDCAECEARLKTVQEAFIAEGLPAEKVRRHRPVAYRHYGGIC